MFFGGKQLYELDPSNKKYLSQSHHSDRVGDDLKIHTNTILITRSGTIGKLNIAPEHWNNWVPNEHIIRVVPANDEISGYIYAWLSSDYAYHLITRYTYGAVVDEIDDKQVSQISIPLLRSIDIQKNINNKVLEANTKRTEAYKLEQEALKILNEQVIYA
ncbi:MAG: restriction endonuclease subunit S [Smithella sp.]|nr:restriction endonuclease subunit S [Smithella sp.]